MTIYALLDIGRTEKHRILALPPWAWFIVVLLLPVVGPGLWLAFGYRREASSRGRGSTRQAPSASAPDDDENYLRFLRQQSERRRKDEERRRNEERRRDADDE